LYVHCDHPTSQGRSAKAGVSDPAPVRKSKFSRVTGKVKLSGLYSEKKIGLSGHSR
jgi:hypothetical protein